MRDDSAYKFRRGEHRTLNVKMSVNQTRREIRALEINCRLRAIVAEADDASALDCDVRLVDLAAENVDDASVFEQQLGGLFTARDGKFLLDVAHNLLPLFATEESLLEANGSPTGSAEGVDQERVRPGVVTCTCGAAL